ncbi:MAG: hypothetical protein IT318_01600 [Anaerolineales bacterium]|nr:hypothetical protein [Anaerolineales bacterium]
MERDTVLKWLSKQPASKWLELLGFAYDEMNQRQREAVFGEAVVSADPPAQADGKRLLRTIRRFQQDSLANRFYAPFNITSKNWMHVPKETKTWFERLGHFLTQSTELTRQGQHVDAVTCFGLLYELIAAMETGEEIVFADELGSWMIPVDENMVIGAYLKSLAVISTPDRYTQIAIPLIKRDARQSFSDKVYGTALRAATAQQKTHLLAEIERQQIETGPPTRARRRPRRPPSTPHKRDLDRR